MSILINGLPELLSPAGDLECLKTAVDFGADAVYLAGQEFGMRTAASNFTMDELEEGIAYAHAQGAKVHVACNTIPRNDEMARLPAFLETVQHVGADALIVADLGTMDLAARYAPKVPIHASVQSGITNYETARRFHELGASRVVLARELSLDEIAEIRAKTPSALELECFAHGALCVSFSARCLLSSYMTGRDANRGDCAQPCRWRYALVEEKRPGQYFPIEENEQGSYILNADDLCMAPYLDRLAKAGVGSIKIEGRAKSHYYVSVVTHAYRGALDSLRCADDSWQLPAWVAEELEKISHRPYSTGFYFGRPNAQTYENAGYVRNYAVAAVVEDWQDGMLIVRMKNKFYAGQIFDCLEPGKQPFTFKADRLFDESNQPIESAPHPLMTVKMELAQPVKKGALLRMKLDDKSFH